VSAAALPSAVDERLLRALRDSRAALEKAERARHEPIAIVGMACRLPGGVADADAFWTLLQTGRDVLTPVPADRWDDEAVHDPDRRAAGRCYTRHGAFVELPQAIDAAFFGLSPREAARLDPQQRLLLETAWEALEDAGATAAGARGGVFLGIGQNHWADLHLRADALEAIDSFTGTGSLPCFAAGRLSHWLGFEGPSFGVDTACSSSLVALHLACRSLRQGECDLALAAGVHLHLAPHVSVFLARTGALAPDGRTKAFSADADGFGRGEGCVTLVLKRLSDAQAAGDRIHALVRGSAVGHDGAAAGLTVPSEPAQAAVVRAALADARVQPAEVGYVEAHGTGTVLGDPIEVRALADVFAAGRPAGTPLLLGAVKSSVGHLEAAAGLAGVVKAVLALRHGEVPPQWHLGTPNPHVDWDRLPLLLPRTPTAWPASLATRIAGVSAFGMSGTNAHVVLQAAPPSPAAGATEQRPHDQLLVLSARTPQALDALAQRWSQHLQAAGATLDWPDTCHAALARRRLFEHRLAVVADSAAAARERLADSQGVLRGRAPIDRAGERPVFLFTGQGSQQACMGRELMRTEPRFREVVEQCASLFDPLLPAPLLDVMHGDGPQAALLHRTDFTQPALFTLQVALAALWRSWGIVPAAVAGHSIGEYAAACTAGVLALEDAVRLVAERGRLMHAMPGDGAMAAVLAPDAQALALRLREQGCCAAAVNSPRELVIAGTRADVKAWVERLGREGLAARELTVSHAFHSPLMAPVRAQLESLARGITFGTPQMDMLSSVDLQWNAVGDAAYWGRQVVEPVDFLGTLRCLGELDHRLFVEIGPRPVLCGLGRASLPADRAVWIPSLQPGTPERRSLLQAAGQLVVQGQALVADAVAGKPAGVAADLPRYPFQRERHWIEPPARAAALAVTPGGGLPLAGRRVPLPFSRDVHYEAVLQPQADASLRDHQVFGRCVVAAAWHLACVLEAAADAFGSSRLRLEDVRLPQALVLPAAGARRLQVLIQPGADGAHTFRTLSCDAAADPAREEAWTAHASGTVRLTDSPPPLQIAGAAGAPANEPAAGFYDALAALGFGLGPSYRWLRRLDGDAGQVRATLAAPADAGGDRVALPPGLLDTCFQVLSRFWPASLAELRASGSVYVPFSLDALELHEVPDDGEELALHASAAPGGASELTPPASLQLRGAAGRLLLQASGFRFRRTGSATLLGAADGEAAPPLLAIHWDAAPLAPSAARPTQWLLLADVSGTAAALAAALQSDGHACRVIAPGENVDAGHVGAAEAVVDLRALDLRATAEAPPTDTLLRAHAAVREVLRACIGRATPPRLWFATRGSQPLGAPSAWPAAVQGAVWGAVSALAAEHPSLRASCIDLDPSSPHDEATMLAHVLAAGADEDCLALRGGQCHVARLRPFDTPAREARFPASATCLVTGGFGALGLAVADWAADRRAGCVVLAGRTLPAAGSEAASAVEALRRRGVRVDCRACDIGDATHADALFASLADLPPLRGVVHAAGTVDDGLLLQQEADAVARVLHPKVAGAWHLHRLTRGLPLDFLWLFASAATLVGSRGQSAYAMANSALDGLAHARRAAGLPALAVDWGAWDAGMAARGDDAQRTRWSARGFGVIRRTQAPQLFDRLLQADAAQVAVLPLAGRGASLPRRFAALVPASAPAPAQRAAVPAIAPTNAQRPATREAVEAAVRSVLAATLGLSDPLAIEPKARLFEIGFDSILALEAAERLARALGQPVHDTVVFEYPTLESLAAHLAGSLAPEPIATRIAPIKVADAAPDRQRIAALSEHEAERLLLAQLQALGGPSHPAR
jgi:acyl transferase domain-containing protein/acyl carrier protein